MRDVLGPLAMAVGWAGATISMGVHLFGIALGWWPLLGGVCWFVYLFAALHVIGVLISIRWI